MSRPIDADALKERFPCPTIDAVPIGIIWKVYADILGAECGDSWIRCDGIEVNTDVGYAMDGVDLFFRLLMKRIRGEVSDG